MLRSGGENSRARRVRGGLGTSSPGRLRTRSGQEGRPRRAPLCRPSPRPRAGPRPAQTAQALGGSWAPAPCAGASVWCQREEPVHTGRLLPRTGARAFQRETGGVGQRRRSRTWEKPGEVHAEPRLALARDRLLPPVLGAVCGQLSTSWHSGLSRRTRRDLSCPCSRLSGEGGEEGLSWGSAVPTPPGRGPVQSGTPRSLTPVGRGCHPRGPVPPLWPRRALQLSA